MTEGRTVGLAEALAGLVEVGVAHGVDEASVRAEGEALAATVAEAAPGAHVDWVRITGGDRGAEDFMAAASRGRRWRSGPTPVLSELVAGRSPGAAAYAKALGDVCVAAADLGEPTPRTVGNATTAAAAQLTALSSPSTPVASASSVAMGTGGADAREVTEAVKGLWGQVMGELKTLSARVREVAAGLVMMIAMIDSAVGHLVPLVWWVALLLATAMALAASHRRSRLAHGAGSGPVRGTEATMVAHAAGGMVVMAALLLAMATGGAAAGAGPGVGVAAHAHGGSGVGASAAEIGVLGVTLAGVYVVASLVVIARSRSPLDRGQYAAMAASAGLMAWGLVL